MTDLILVTESMLENELRNKKNEGQAELLWAKVLKEQKCGVMVVWESGADPGSGHTPDSREGEC